ncbi:MAG: dienelactone hydrolase family protein [Alphaproteobacteria bacterium]|nr:dienelactone hydrolase family protein [Alphaproteobacteria bacterium]
MALLFTTPAWAGETVQYRDGDLVLEGYFAPSQCGTEKAPVVLVVHQWMGLGDYEKSRADMLAEKCYNAFAVDMYGQGIRPTTKAAAGAQSGIYKNNPAIARGRMNAALDYVRRRTDVDPTRVAAIGYCFGGTMALELARSGAPLDAAISFHGGLGSKAPVTQAGAIKAAIQVHHGADDPHVPEAEVEAFINEMNTAGADWVFTSYADAVHAFTEKGAGNDPASGAAYNAKADRRSWDATLDFLGENLAP